MNSTNIADGGPAFPTRGENGMSHGMSLRAYYVGQALSGLDLEEWIERVLADETMESKRAYRVIATHCIGVADACIAALTEGAKP